MNRSRQGVHRLKNRYNCFARKTVSPEAEPVVVVVVAVVVIAVVVAVSPVASQLRF